MGSPDDHPRILDDARIETLFYELAACEERAMTLEHRVPGRAAYDWNPPKPPR